MNATTITYMTAYMYNFFFLHDISNLLVVSSALIGSTRMHSNTLLQFHLSTSNESFMYSNPKSRYCPWSLDYSLSFRPYKWYIRHSANIYILHCTQYNILSSLYHYVSAVPNKLVSIACKINTLLFIFPYTLYWTS